MEQPLPAGDTLIRIVFEVLKMVMAAGKCFGRLARSSG